MHVGSVVSQISNHVSSSKSRFFEKNKIEDAFIYEEMPAAVSKYLKNKTSGDDLRRMIMRQIKILYKLVLWEHRFI